MLKRSAGETTTGGGTRMSLRCRDSSILFIILFSLVKDSREGANEKRLLNELFIVGEYNKLERPVFNESDSLVVNFSLVLQQIIDVDEKNQIINTNLWLNMRWFDYSLVWNETEFGGIKSIRLPPGVIWKPDILMYNSADEDIDSTFPTNVIVSSTGECLWVPPGLFLSTCTIDITWFPFDDQFCKMKFGSWTYDSSGIDLQLQSDSGDLSSFILNGEWQLMGMPARRSVVSYDCCPEQYIDVTFTVHIRRRTLFYGFNLIIPCVLISSIALLTFTLPPESGEKISLGVTILLSLTVFLLLVAEAMPPTSDALPLIGMYFAAIMLMCSLSVVFTVLVLNYHHRTPNMHVMPKWVKKIVCEWLAWLVRMQRPGQEPPQFVTTPRLPHRKRRNSTASVHPEIIGLTTKSSKSLLANVLNLDSWKSPPPYINQNGNGQCARQNPSTTDYPNKSPSSNNVCPRKNSSIIEKYPNKPPSGRGRYARKDSANNERHSRNESSSINGYPGKTTYGINGHPRKISTGIDEHQSNTPSNSEGHKRKTSSGNEGYSNPTKPPSLSDVCPDKSSPDAHSYQGQNPPSQGYQNRPDFSPFVHLSNGFAKGNYVPLSCQTGGSRNDEGSRGPTDAVTETLGEILGQLRFLAERVKETEKEEGQCNDWKFAAMVIDRVCLISFTVFTVGSTFAILFSAPHVIA